MQIKNQRVRFLGRKNGSSENVFNVEGNCFDMSCYVDSLRAMYDGLFDYMIIEPVHFKDSLF